MLQIFSPDVDVVVVHADRQFVPIVGNCRPASGCQRKFVHPAIVYLNFIKFFAFGIERCKNKRPIVASPNQSGKFIVKRHQRSFRFSLQIGNQILEVSGVMDAKDGQLLSTMRER